MCALTASYVGLPNMVNAMIELLHAAGYRKRDDTEHGGGPFEVTYAQIF